MAIARFPQRPIIFRDIPDFFREVGGYDLPMLPGIVARDKALRNNDQPPMGDLSAALETPR